MTRKKRRQIIEQARQSQETGYALLIPFGAWLQNSIKLKQRVEQIVSLRKADQSQFSVPDLVAGMVMAFQAGVVRSKRLSRLVPEVKLAESIGLPHFFGATTASDLMKQAQRRHLKEMQRVLRGVCLEAVEHDPGPEIDLVADTTGHPSDSRHREGVRVGYCNGRKEPCLKSGRVVINGRPAFANLYPGNENPPEPYETGVALARRLCRQYPDRRVHRGLGEQDEFIHPIHDEPTWREAVYFDVYDPETNMGALGYLGVHPNLEIGDQIFALWQDDVLLARFTRWDFNIPRDIGEERFSFGPLHFYPQIPFQQCAWYYDDGYCRLDVTFHAIHKPYCWAESHDSLAKTNSHHYEQQGFYTGTVRVGHQKYEINGVGGARSRVGLGRPRGDQTMGVGLRAIQSSVCLQHVSGHTCQL